MPTYEISHGLDAWLRSSHRGISSNTIVQHLTGFPALAGPRPSHPHDAPDLGRCIRLLRAAPELADRLGGMRTCSPVWAGLVDRWLELTATYLREYADPPDGTCDTYKAMRDIIDPIQAAERQAGHRDTIFIPGAVPGASEAAP